MSKKVGKTICLFSAKGGVGKTVLSLNMAGVASSMGLKTLIMDFDVHTGAVSMIINEEIKKTIYHLTDDLLNNRYKKLEDYIYKYNDNIDVLSSPKDPRQGSKITSKYLNLLLDKVKRDYDLVLIDTGSEMSEVNVMTLELVDEVLFVIDNDLFTLKNTRNIINIFNDVDKTNFKVLLNSSIDYKTPYFSMSDIKKIIGANIDYMLSKNLFIKDITSYLYDCKIPSLVKGFAKSKKDDFNTMKLIINDVLAGDEDEKN